MKLFSHVVAASVLAGFALSHAQLNVNSKLINFRTSTTASGNTTYHYGDLKLEGGNGGTSWGWLYANQLEINGPGNIYGALYAASTAYFNMPVTMNSSLNVVGSKNFIHPHPTDTTLAIRYVAIEAGEALTVARGVAKTRNGSATIALPQDFSLVTSDQGAISVILTPEGSPSLLFVRAKSKKSIEVEIKGVDFREYGDVDFSYQVTGVRDGFEDQNPIIKLSEIATPKVAKTAAQVRHEEFANRLKKLNQKRGK